MAKEKMIRPIRTEAQHRAALEEIERYFENEPKPGTAAADRFDLLALVIEDHERKHWPMELSNAIRNCPLCVTKNCPPWAHDLG
jgi:HTH-type transcriptional regulator/antitoxin HigA